MTAVTAATTKSPTCEGHVHEERGDVESGGGHDDGCEDAGVAPVDDADARAEARPACLPTLCTMTVLSTATTAPMRAPARDEQENGADEPRHDHDVHDEDVAHAPDHLHREAVEPERRIDVKPDREQREVDA